MPGRIEFVILWTGRSPPAALHPASWRRSCIQFQAGERLPEEDLHLSDLARSQAHIPPASAVWNFSFSLFSIEKQIWRLKLKLHAAEADGICDHLL